MTFGGSAAYVWNFGNGNNGVHANSYSYVELGGTSYGGTNTIRSNVGYNALAQNTSYIESQYTYWGTYSQMINKISYDGSSYVDYSNWLSHPAFKMVADGTNDEEEEIAAEWNQSSPEVALRVREMHRELLRDSFERERWLSNPDPEVQRAARVLLLGKAIQEWDFDIATSLASEMTQSLYSDRELGYRALFVIEYMQGNYDRAVSRLEHLSNPVHHRLLEELLPSNVVDERDKEVFGKNVSVGVSNHPNPFNPSTIIRYEVPQSGHVNLVVYDILGRQVAELVNGAVEVGSYTVSFDGTNLASGIYVYRLQTAGQVISGKMMLVK